MRPRDKRPNAWHAHRFLASPAPARPAFTPTLGDALAMGGAVLGSLFGGSLARGALATMAYEATDRAMRVHGELEQRGGTLTCFVTNLLDPKATGPAYCGLERGHDGPHAFTIPAAEDLQR